MPLPAILGWLAPAAIKAGASWLANRVVAMIRRRKTAEEEVRDLQRDSANREEEDAAHDRMDQVPRPDSDSVTDRLRDPSRRI